jgi:hypothetical protein
MGITDEERISKIDTSLYDVIVFDEIYLVDIQKLVKIKQFCLNNPDKIIIATGDTSQLPPINDYTNRKVYSVYADECINLIFPYEIFLFENERLKSEEDKIDFFCEKVPGFKSIYLNSHLNQYVQKRNLFGLLYTSLINTTNPPIESQYTILGVYLISFFIFIYRALTKRFDYLDLTLISVFLFFYFIHFVPEPRVHVGLVFFNIFYIFNNLYLFYIKKFKVNLLVTWLFLFLAIFSILNTKIDNRYYETKLVVDKINLLKQKNNCDQLNYLLDEYEIWLMKNIYQKDCNFYYDFKNQKNILY